MHKSICLIFLMLLCLTSNSIADTWALLVGINDYQDSRISDLNYTVNDVTRFRDILIDKDACAVPKDKVYLMTNNSIGDELPTNTNVIFRLENLVSRIKPEDTFIFYFSGHGMMRDDKQYLLTINSDPRSLTTLAASAIPLETIHELLNKVKAHQVLIILDSCRNDPEKGKGDKDNSLTNEIARGFFVKSRSAPDGMPGSSATLYASSVGERAYEWDSMKSGVFSYYLVEGLKGACIDANNEVTLRGLANYVINNVRGWSLDNLPTGKGQTPWLVSEGAADMTLAKIIPKFGKLDIQITPAGSKILVNGKNMGQTPTTIDLPVGQHKVEISRDGYVPVVRESISIGRDQTETISGVLEQKIGSLELVSNPSKARIIIDDKEIGYTPKSLQLPAGSHKIKLSKDGHHDYEETVDVQWNKNIKRDITINVIIETPTKIDTGFRNDKPYKIPESANMALRSLVVPGMGQFYGKRNISGTTFMVLGLGTLATSVVGYLQYNKAMDEYDKSITDYHGAITSDSALLARQAIINAHNNADSKFKFQRIALIATGSVWVINALHALVIGPAESGVHNSDLSDANINAYRSEDSVCVALSYRF